MANLRKGRRCFVSVVTVGAAGYLTEILFSFVSGERVDRGSAMMLRPAPLEPIDPRARLRPARVKIIVTSLRLELDASCTQ